jgi:hypothetical protein
MWRDWTTRSRKSSFSYKYLKNCHRAAGFFLNEYVLAARTRRRGFGSMLAQMHRLTIGTLTRVPVGKYNPQSMFPGTTRDYIAKSPSRGPVAQMDLFVNFGPELQACLGKLRLALKNQQSIRGIPVTVELMYGGRKYSFTLAARRDWICYNPMMVGVRRRSRFEIAFGDRFLMGIPPLDKEVPTLLKRGKRLLEQAIDFPRKNVLKSRRSRTRWLKMLARYYQTMTVAHPFKSQNNSLFMNQINCLIFLHSGGYVSHGNLDGLALMLPTSAFEKVFIDFVGDETKGRTNARAH